MKKRFVAIALALSMLMTPIAYGHSGRTDAYGGHHDYKNVSGLGSYHYHHGYGPHLHPGGVCPYESGGSNTGLSTATATSSDLQAKIADFGITLNGTTIDNTKLKYPVLSYNDITYVPMTYNCARTLGLTTNWDGVKLTIDQGDAEFTKDVSGSCTTGKACTVEKVDFNVYASGSKLGDDSDYPFLSYKDITYLPLTTSVAEALDLSVQWNESTGITVSSK